LQPPKTFRARGKGAIVLCNNFGDIHRKGGIWEDQTITLWINKVNIKSRHDSKSLNTGGDTVLNGNAFLLLPNQRDMMLEYSVD
jgi:hypothetical protein